MGPEKMGQDRLNTAVVNVDAVSLLVRHRDTVDHWVMR